MKQQKIINRKRYTHKIETRVQGLDDLFYGGLRLPDTSKQDGKMDGIVIVIYGKNGVGKTNLSMQIMRGVHKSLSNNAVGEGHTGKQCPLFCTLNHRSDEVERMFRSQEVLKAMNSIGGMSSTDNECFLCSYFKNLGEKFSDKSSCQCTKKDRHECKLCEWIRNEILTYNPRLETLNLNEVGATSESTKVEDLDKGFFHLLRAKCVDEIKKQGEETQCLFFQHEPESNYLPEPLTIFNDIKKFIHEERDLFNPKKDEPFFGRSSVLIEGFSILDTDALERLPYGELIEDLKKLSAVSLLVFDERAKDLRINADIVIEMCIKEDPDYKYQYRELQIEKCDLQPRVRGWHRYSTNHDTLVCVYPNVWKLLTNRFSKENAHQRMVLSDIWHPESFFSFSKDKTENYFEPKQYETLSDNQRQESIKKTLESYEQKWNSAIGVYKGNYSKVHVYTDCDAIYNDVRETTIVYIIIGKKEQNIRKDLKQKLNGDRLEQEHQDEHTHFWVVDSAFIWPEVFVNTIQRYIRYWMQAADKEHADVKKHLHIVIDDFAYINQYPFLERERMLIPALLNVCNNEIGEAGHKHKHKNVGVDGVDIRLSLLCSSQNSSHYAMIQQMAEIYGENNI